MFVLLAAVYAFLHLMVIPYMNWTPAGWVCPLVCEGCSMSARTIHFPNERGDSEVDEVAVCRNRTIDVDRESVDDILKGSPSRLDPYRLRGAAIVAVECGLWLALMMPLLSILVRRNGWALRDELEAALARAKADLRSAKVTGREDSSEPYR